MQVSNQNFAGLATFESSFAGRSSCSDWWQNQEEVNTFPIGKGHTPVTIISVATTPFYLSDSFQIFQSWTIWTSTTPQHQQKQGRRRKAVRNGSKLRKSAIVSEISYRVVLTELAYSGTQSLSGRGVRLSFVCSWFNHLIRISDIVVDNCAICRNHIMDLC